MLRVILLLSCLLGYSSASLVGGRHTYIHYNSRCGTWNDRGGTNRGKILEECCPIDATYPGSPWQQLSVSYRQGTSFSQFLGNSAFSAPNDCPSYQTTSERVLDDGTGTVGIEHVFRMGLLTVTKTETWEFEGKTLLITFKVKYSKDAFLTNCRPISNLTVMHAVDPDQDLQPFSTFQTFNDVIFNGGSGLFAEAVGPQSCKTMGYGICQTRNSDGDFDEVGFTRWIRTTPAPLTDPNGQLRDDTMHYQHTEARPLECGDEREFRFFAVWGRCVDEARANFRAAHRRFCNPCSPLGLLAVPPTRRCRGRCPCTNRNANCTCTYKCPTGPIFVPDDIKVAKVESSALLSTCSGRRRRRQVSGEELNLEEVKLTDSECEVAKLERELLDQNGEGVVSVADEGVSVKG